MITNEEIFTKNYMYPSINAPAGFVTVTNNGGYVAYFTLGYQFELKNYNEFSPSLTYGKSFKILYPSEARELRLTMYCYTISGDFKTICKKASYTPFNRCFALGGTLINPNCKEVPCSSINGTPPQIQNHCCCCCNCHYIC